MLTKRGFSRIYLTDELSLDQLDALLAQPGEPLKSHHKRHVRRVEAYLIKESLLGWGLGMIRHTFQRSRYRRAWTASHYLRDHGIGAPRPVAFVEKRFAGIIAGNLLVSEFLENYRNVEDFLYALIQRGAGRDTIMSFLLDLAAAVNQLPEVNAYHADLSGKNIFTRDGKHFVFIDLDAVELNRSYDDALRLKNHVQLYDSFCDLLNDTMLVPFLERMLPPHLDPRVWMPKVRKAQRHRRSRTEARAK